MRYMNLLGALGCVLGLGLICGSAGAGQEPLHVQGGPQVQKGAHLARLGDCMGCHTYNENQPYAGGRPMVSPFGTFYTANLTQDKQTGIGKWSYSDFKRALHEGRDNEGNFIYPAMPFTSYTKLSDSDVHALWAYFKQIKPIHNQVKPSKLVFIHDYFGGAARFVGLGAWRISFFDSHRFKPAPNRSAEYNKGAYYVQALGHCSSCHTPRNLAFAQQKDQFLNGAVLNGWYSPRISPGPDSAINDWSVDDLTTYLKTGELGKRTTVVGPMHEVWHDSLRHLPKSDLHAMAFYLKNMPADRGKMTPTTPVKITASDASLGQQVYAQQCQTCHRANGEGNYGVAPALKGNNLVIADKSNSVVMSILEGFMPSRTWGAMPSFAKDLSNKEVAAVANYVRTTWQNNSSADATPSMVANSRNKDINFWPPGGWPQGAFCPNLPSKVIAPALAPGQDKLLAAYSNSETLKDLVSSYQSARPDAPKNEVVLALTASYCRALINENKANKSKISHRTRNRLYQFSQKVADEMGL